MSERKNPEEIVKAIMNALNTDSKTIEKISKEIGSSWQTVWFYLEFIDWIQKCPKIHRNKITERIEAWRRDWGKLPK